MEYTGAKIAETLSLKWDTLRRQLKAEGMDIAKREPLSKEQIKVIASLFSTPARNRSNETVEVAREILSRIDNRQQVIVQNTVNIQGEEKKGKKEKRVKRARGYSLKWILSDWFVSISAVMFYAWQVRNLAEFSQIEGSPAFFGWLFALGFCFGSVLVSAHFDRPEWLGWFGFIDGTVDFILQEPWEVTGPDWATIIRAWAVALIVAIAAGILLSMYGKIIYHKLKEQKA